MEASSVTRRLLAAADVRNWAWWRLPWLLRAYVGIVPAHLRWCWSATPPLRPTWHLADLEKFLLLLGCGLISVAATPRTAYTQGALVRDFITVWVLPVAILLPPVYAMVAPIPLLMLTQWRVHRGVIYRRVFTAAAMGLAYGAASLVFHAVPRVHRGPLDRHRRARAHLDPGGRRLRDPGRKRAQRPHRGGHQALRSHREAGRSGTEPRSAAGRLRGIRPRAS